MLSDQSNKSFSYWQVKSTPSHLICTPDQTTGLFDNKIIDSCAVSIKSS